ncbi:MAG: cysteine--tRNA ligase [Desulfitobacteriaceae bacterium]
MSLKLFDTMTRQKEEFNPRQSGKVGIYACGPTTYNFFHLGNARMLVAFDMIRRYLMYRGYDVNYVQNFTDVDDKIIKRAKEEGMDPLALAQKYIDEYFIDAKALNILPATVHPKATEHIADILEIIQGLLDVELAYVVDGDVYFSVNLFPGYGKLSGRNLEDMQAGARVEVDERKKYPMDFALWKAAKPGEPAWQSPWGMGRPGWHIECTAMSLKYLGAGFDIHGGGGDLVFPHHENEIAQSEGYLRGVKFANYWIHTAFLTVNQEKMSKSLGNFFTIRELLEHFSGEVLRFYLLSTHYRSLLDFDDHKLTEAQKGLVRLQTSVRLVTEALNRVNVASGSNITEENQVEDSVLTQAANQVREDFVKAMDDDFNSSLAYASLFELAKVINSHLGANELEVKGLRIARQTLLELAGVLGFDLANPTPPKALAEVGNDKILSSVMDVLVQVRNRLRQKKDWETADYIRDALKEVNVFIEDTPQGTRWKVKG